MSHCGTPRLPLTDHPLVTLRRLERSDAPAWYAYLADPVVVEHTSWDLRSIDDLQSNFDDMHRPSRPRPSAWLWCCATVANWWAPSA